MNKKIKIFIAIGMLTGLLSCLDENPSMNPGDSQNVIEFYATTDVQVSTNDAIYPVFADAYDIAPEVDHEIIINYAGDEVAPENIEVTVAVNEQAVIEYNAWYNLSQDPDDEDPDEDVYDIMPTTVYSIPNPTVVIPKGERKATLIVKLKTADFNFDESYALGLTISSASRGTISGNFGTAVFSLQAKNKYDGVYELRFKHTATNGDRTGFNNTETLDWPGEVELRTTGPSSVAMFDTWAFNDYIHPLRTTTAWSGTGQATPIFTFDLETDIITSVTNYYPAATNGRQYTIDEDVQSSRDPETGDIYAAFILTQPGFGPFVYRDTLTYIGPR